MMDSALDLLTTDEFCTRVCFVATPPALRRLLQRSPEVRAIRQALNTGALSEDDISGFVTLLMKDLKRGTPFVHDPAISALAVALEKRATAFAEVFLSDLAKLQAAEMSMSIRVARECLKAKALVSSNARTVLHSPKVATNVRFGGGNSAFISPDVRSLVHATWQMPVFSSLGVHGYGEPVGATLHFGGN